MRDQEIPWCHFMLLYNGVYEHDEYLHMGDPKIEEAKKAGKFITEIKHASVHYFDEHGYLSCKNCGWTP